MTDVLIKNICGEILEIHFSTTGGTLSETLTSYPERIDIALKLLGSAICLLEESSISNTMDLEPLHKYFEDIAETSYKG